MPLCRFRTQDSDLPRLGLIVGDRVLDVVSGGGPATLAEALRGSVAELREQLDRVAEAGGEGIALSDITLLAPIDQQEVWAAGVTYSRSRDARMEESQEATVYDRVYAAERPEIFFKAMASRVVNPGEAVAIRGDSTWDVPEPELALVLTGAGEVAGYTAGNDVSSRSIEGENPLYLPQAKVYSKCAGLGPVIALPWELADPNNAAVDLTITRDGAVAFAGATNTNQLHRTLADLVEYLFRDNDFPSGAILMTGTGIIPPSEFTLQAGDLVDITIAGIGTLSNPVIRL
ncbi:MAG: fumarylacetoacetate hydrolase family protein [Thermomicrobiales bacterium]